MKGDYATSIAFTMQVQRQDCTSDSQCVLSSVEMSSDRF